MFLVVMKRLIHDQTLHSTLNQLQAASETKKKDQVRFICLNK